MKKLLALVLTGVLGVSVLTACGSSSSAPSAAAETASTEVAAASTETETASASGSALDKDTLIIGTNAAFPPFEYVEGKSIVGFDITMGQKIAKDAGMKLEVVDMAFDSLIPALQSGTIDFIAAGMSVNEERKKNVDFSETYFESEQVIIVRK